jgi:hypothetical protein
LKLPSHWQLLLLLQTALGWHSSDSQQASSSMQAPSQSLLPALHAHWLSTQLTPAPQSPASQQAPTGIHSLPQGKKFESQLKSQAVPLQVALPSAGTGHGVQESPHASKLVFERHTPPQSWVPEGHSPSQTLFSSMHAPRQATWPPGQDGMHWPLSQLTLPPEGAVHGSSQATPQVSTEPLLTQLSSH